MTIYNSIILTDQDIKEIKAHPDYIGADSYTVVLPGLTHLGEDETLTETQFLKCVKLYGWGAFSWLPDLSDTK
jgi:hypothetical protein